MRTSLERVVLRWLGWSWPRRVLPIVAVVFAGVWVAAQTTPWLSVTASPYKAGPNNTFTAISSLAAGTDFRGSLTAITTAPATNTEVEYVIGVEQGSLSLSTIQGIGRTELSLSLPDGLALKQITGKPPSWVAAGSTGNTVRFLTDSLNLTPSNSWSPGLGGAFDTNSGNGDGFTPIFYRSEVDGRRKIFMIHHRTFNIPGATSNINCIDAITGAQCTGYPKLLKDNGVTIGIPWAPRFVVKGQRIFFPGMLNNTSVGVGCWNAEYDRACTIALDGMPAYLAVSTQWSPGVKNNELGGVVELPAQPNRLFLTYWGGLHCVDLASQSQCAGSPMVFQPTLDPGTGRTAYGRGSPGTAETDILVAGTAAQPDSMVFTVINGYLSCWDLRTWPGARCNTGDRPFSNAVFLPLDDQLYQSTEIALLSHYLDRNGNTIGACLSVGNQWLMFNSRVRCYDTHGSDLQLPSLLAGRAENNRNTSNTRNIYNVHLSTKIGTRVYYALPAKFSVFTNGVQGSDQFSDLVGYAAEGTTGCWDFAAGAEGSGGAPCALFTDGGANNVIGGRRWNKVNPYGVPGGVVATGSGVFDGRTADYGYTVDPSTPECLYGLGDAGRIWSFSATTGITPCPANRSIDQVLPDPAPFCQANAAAPNWSSLLLRNLPSTTRTATVRLFNAALCPTSIANVDNCPAGSQLGAVTRNWANAAEVSNAETLVLSPTTLGALRMSGASVRLRVDFAYEYGVTPTNWTNFSFELNYDRPSGRIGEICVRTQVRNCPAPRLDTVAAFRRASDGQVVGQTVSTLTTDGEVEERSDVALALNSTTVKANRALYRATYRATDWSGDLTAFGTLNGNPQPTAIWSSAAAPAGNAAALIPSAASRLILTSKPGASSPIGRMFTATDINTADMAQVQSHFGASAAERTRLIDYLRGDRSNEVGIGSNSSDVVYRRRMTWTGSTTVTPLGAIVKSEPVHDRGMVYVQANDGMLHAFDAATGVEKFAYVPATLFSRLKALSDPGYAYTPLMEGQVIVTDFVLDPLVDGANTTRVLIGSTGGIAPALYAIKVGGLPATAPTANDVLWESTHPALGQANGRLALITLNNVPHAVLGNGPGSSSNTAQLIVVNLRTGVISAVDTGSANTGLSAPTVLTSSTTGLPLAIYAGDLNGRLWRFPVNASGVVGTPVALFSDPDRKIVAAPVVSSFSPIGGSAIPNGYMVMFGTGQPVDRTALDYDASTAAEQKVQRVYGILDTAASDGVTPTGAGGITPAHLLQQTWTNNVLSENALNYPNQKGWYFELKAGDVANKIGAERVLSSLAYDFSTQSVTAVTTVPKNVDCPTPALADSSAVVAMAFTGGRSTQLQFVADSARSRLTFDGTLGGFVRADGSTTVNTNYTSNARSGSSVLGATGRASSGTISSFTMSSSIAAVRRTSWIQLY